MSLPGASQLTPISPLWTVTESLSCSRREVMGCCRFDTKWLLSIQDGAQSAGRHASSAWLEIKTATACGRCTLAAGTRWGVGNELDQMRVSAHLFLEGRFTSGAASVWPAESRREGHSCRQFIIRAGEYQIVAKSHWQACFGGQIRPEGHGLGRRDEWRA